MIVPLTLVCLLLTADPAPADGPSPAPAATVADPATKDELLKAPLPPLAPLGAKPELELPRSEPPELAADELSLGWTLARTLVVLGLVIGLAYLVLNVGLRKLLGIKPSVGANIVTILERVPLDQKRSLFVIEAAGEVLLVGGTDASLSLLSKLDAGEVAKARAAAERPAAVQLSPLVQRLLGRKDLPPDQPVKEKS